MGEKHSATIPQPQHTLARLRMILFWFRCVHSRRLPCLIVFVAMENRHTHTHTHWRTQTQILAHRWACRHILPQSFAV